MKQMTKQPTLVETVGKALGKKTAVATANTSSRPSTAA